MIGSLRNMFRYLRRTISTESRHVASDSLQVGHPFDNSQITKINRPKSACTNCSVRVL